MTTKTKKAAQSAADTPTQTPPADAALILDFEEFAHYFEGEDITEEAAREFLQAYWALALEIMSMGFGLHPVQQARNACGKHSESTGSPPIMGSDAVYLTSDHIAENFEHMAVAEPGTNQKGI